MTDDAIFYGIFKPSILKYNTSLLYFWVPIQFFLNRISCVNVPNIGETIANFNDKLKTKLILIKLFLLPFA